MTSQRRMIRLAAGLVLMTAALRAAPALAARPAPTGENERAKAAIEKALEQDPSNSSLWAHLGFAWRHLGDVEQAQRAFEKAVSLNPKNLQAQFMLGLIYEKKKLKDEAISAWKACLQSPEERIRDIAKNHLHKLESP